MLILDTKASASLLLFFFMVVGSKPWSGACMKHTSVHYEAFEETGCVMSELLSKDTACTAHGV